VKSVECGLMCFQALVEGQRGRRPNAQQIGQGVGTAVRIAAQVARVFGG
jgi:hypothetical protein